MKLKGDCQKASLNCCVRYRPIWIGLFVFFADFFSKYWIYRHVPIVDDYLYQYPYGGIGVFQNFFGVEFSINHATNRGAAWGLLSQFQLYLLIFRMLLILGLFVYVFFYNKRREWQVPFALIIAGAFGNVIDFFLYGHVIDMFHFVLWGYDYPIFNVADSAIFIGIFWLFLSSWCDKKA